MANDNIAYPGWGYSFAGGELTIGDKIFRAFNNITASQPTEEGEAGYGAGPYPLTRDEGQVAMGSFSIDWSDIGERNLCIEMLADIAEQQGLGGYRNVLFELSYTMKSKDPKKKLQHYKLEQCRFLDEPDEAAAGSLIGGGTEGSFMRKLINGRPPH